jgi:diguanylate cyclase (GGDEF)-like protein
MHQAPQTFVKRRGLRYAMVVVTAVFGVLASMVGLAIISNNDKRLFELKLAELAKSHELAINADLSYAAEAVYTLRAYLDTGDQVTRTAYQAFAKSLRARLAGLRDTGWAVRVTRDEREAFERAGRNQGFANFQIWERDAAGNPMRAADRDEYYPIFYPDPAEVTAKVIGFDLASEPVRAETLRRARMTGRPAATPPINLITVAKPVGGFMSFLPVYGRNREGAQPADPPVGFVYGVFETGLMIENILAAKTPVAAIDVYLFDPKGPIDNRLIYWHSSRARSTQVAAPSEGSLLAGPHLSSTLTLLDREWGAIYRPTDALAASLGGWLAYAVFGTGLGFTIMIVAYLLVSLHRTERLEFLTASLHQTTEDLRRDREKIAHMALHDAMTGLPNRATFRARLQQAFADAARSGDPFAVLCLDVDHFKDVNDTLGHPLGDALLQIVSCQLRRIVRETDIVARLGGDEFAVLVARGEDPSIVETLARRINTSLAEPYQIDGNEVRVSASIGVATYAKSVKSPDELMANADLALYRAKAAGRNQFCFFSAELDCQLRERVAIAAELRAALERNELELYYQPQVNARSGRIVGMEALVRWNHPSRGVLLAGLFVPLAETTGTIVALGRWVIEESCRQVARWNAQGLTPPPVAVNFSAAQVKAASNLAGNLSEILALHGIAPEAIEIELTESALMEAVGESGGVIESVRALGVGVAIDDFGTGYCSLAHLRSFGISRLKIAREFIHGLGHNPGDIAIVRAVIGLARELDIAVIAEGVETAEQLAFLDAAGCCCVQGYYFSRPVPAARAAEFLRRGSIEADGVLGEADSPALSPMDAEEPAGACDYPSVACP